MVRVHDDDGESIDIDIDSLRFVDGKIVIELEIEATAEYETVVTTRFRLY